MAADKGANDRAASHDKQEPQFLRRTEKLSSRLYRVNPTRMVGRLTAKERLPASLITAPNSSTRVGMRNSPPATPSSEAMTPTMKPAAMPARSCRDPVSNGAPAAVSWANSRGAIYMPTESMARWREVSSFECHACGETLESWNTALVPSYRLIVVPVMASE